MKKSFQIYIGENNSTHEVELEKITSTLSKYFDGFTVQNGIGFWRGQQEKTVIISIYDDEQKILACVQLLKTILEQDAIAVQELKPLKFI